MMTLTDRERENAGELMTGTVAIGGGLSALELLHGILDATCAQHPAALGEFELPGLDRFRHTYADVLPAFELTRLGSPQCSEVGEFALGGLARRMVYETEQSCIPLADRLLAGAAPLALETCQGSAAQRGWSPSIVYNGERWNAERIGELGSLLVSRGVITPAAGAALSWVADEVFDADRLNLTGRRIAMLGAGAEMAPTRHWLEAGADVLWLDTRPPPDEWLDARAFSGTLHWPSDNADLLSQPDRVLATLVEFAAGAPLDLGLYAYAPGQARELRLTVAMNAIVDALPDDAIATVTMLVSPTTPTALDTADLAIADRRRSRRAWWETACARLGLLGSGGGSLQAQQVAVTRTVVPIQGASYQAAQYLGKILIAQRWHARGLRVSANTAAITRTRSLDHPVFAAAFGGAAALGVETLVPRQSQRINGLLAVADWMRGERNEPGAVRVHGGIHTLPYPLEPALRLAAAIGFARSPRLLRGLLSRRS